MENIISFQNILPLSNICQFTIHNIIIDKILPRLDEFELLDSMALFHQVYE